MAATGIIQRRDTKLNLIADPPLIGEIVFATDTEEFGTIIGSVLVWRKFEDLVQKVNGQTGIVTIDLLSLGIPNVENTADIDKPVSTATHNEIITAIAGVPQSDWNELDALNKAYIQNKPTNITLQGNTFNSADELVQLDATGILPALDGSQLTNLPEQLPNQATNANKFLSTDGTNPLWADLDGNISPITLKRTNTALSVPTTADISLGEIYINTNDGKIYFKKDDGTEQIIAVSNDGHIHDITDITGLVAALAQKIETSEKGSASGIATLDINGKIPNSQLPPLAITEVFTADSEVNQLALTVQSGDVCVRTDINTTYIALNSSNSAMTDWQEIKTPTASASSVNGQTGVVVLDTDDINEGSSNLYFTIPRAISAIGATKDDAGNTSNDLWSANKIINYVGNEVGSASPYYDTVDPDNFADDSSHHRIGQVWVNTTTNAKFICVDNTNTTAVWDLVGFSSGLNIGTGSNVFKQITGTDLEFRTLLSNSSKLSITENADDITLDVTTNDSGTTVNDLWSASKIQSSIDSGVSTLTASNTGTGSDVFKQITGTDLEFRTLLSNSSKLSITENVDDITLDVTINDSGTTIDDLWSANKIQSSIDLNLPIVTNVDPTVNDDTYGIGQLWQNTSYNTTYICNDNTVGAAVWERVDNQIYYLANRYPNSNDDKTKGVYKGQICVRGDYRVLLICIDDTIGAAQWERLPKLPRKLNTPPTSSNSFYLGRVWVDTTTRKLYICSDSTSGAAIWDNLITEHNGLVNIDKPVVKNESNIINTDIDCSLGNFFYKNISADATFTFSNVPSGYFEITIELTNAGSYTVDFPASVRFSDSIAPTYSTRVDVVKMYTRDSGTNWFAKLDITNA